MTTRKENMQEWDANGNLIRDEWVEVEEPEIDPAMLAFVSTLSLEQQEALRKALGQ
jgi:hypothetical protein